MAWFWSWLLVLGAVTVIGGVLAGRMRGSSSARLPGPPPSRLLLGVLLAAIALAFCLPGSFPFARGFELGYGVLLGAGAAIIAFAAVRAARPSDEYWSRMASATAAGGAAVLWVAVTEIVFRGDPGYALLGGLAGGLLVLLPVAWDRDDAGTKAFTGALLVAGLASLLAIAHYQLAPERLYWPLPIIPLAAGLFGVVLGALLFGRGSSARWATALSVIVLETAACLGSRVLIQHQQHLTVPPQFAALVVLGWLTFVLIAAASGPDDKRPFALIAPALLAVVSPIIAFNIAGGYGAAIMLAAGLPLSVALRRREGGGALYWAIGLGVLFLAYRLYLAQFSESFRFGQTLEFGRHYVFLGLAAGLLWVAQASVCISQAKGYGGRIAQLAGLALLPAVLFVVFGYEALLGLILGLWLAQFALPLWGAAEWEWRGLPGLFLPLAAVWGLIIPNWASFMLDQPRWVRGLIIGAAAALALALLALMRARNSSPSGRAAESAEG